MSACNDTCKFYKHCWSRGESLIEDGEECKCYEPERPHGEWSALEYGYKCSACTAAFYTQYNFCPRCGADMRKRGEAREE